MHSSKLIYIINTIIEFRSFFVPTVGNSRHLDGLTQELTRPLKQYMNDFPDLKKIHPFEKALVELTVGQQEYKGALTDNNNLRKKILNLV